MAKELRRIGYDEFAAHIKSIFDRLITEKEPVVIEKEGQDLAVLRPAKPAKRRVPRGKPFTKDDPLWNLAGQGASGLGDVSANKHKYVADAYADLHT